MDMMLNLLAVTSWYIPPEVYVPIATALGGAVAFLTFMLRDELKKKDLIYEQYLEFAKSATVVVTKCSEALDRNAVVIDRCIAVVERLHGRLDNDKKSTS